MLVNGSKDTCNRGTSSGLGMKRKIPMYTLKETEKPYNNQSKKLVADNYI